MTARAIASRCRWPPEKLIPPWATGMSRPSACGADEAVRRRHPQRFPHLVVGRVGLPVAQVARRRFRRTGNRVAAPARSPTTAARCRSPAHRCRRRAPTPDVTSYIRQISDTSVDLPDPGGPDDRGRGAGPGCQRNILQHRPIGSRIAERGIAQVDRTVDGWRPDGFGGAGDHRLGGQHLGDPFGTRRCPWHQDQDERREQHRHQDLHEVGQERDQRAHLHLAGVDPHAAEPDQRDARDVDHQRGDRQHQRLPTTRRQRGVRQRLVRLGESVALEGLSREGADHPDTRQLLAHHPVDAVDEPLHAAEDRQQVRHHPVVGQRQHGNADQQQPRQPGVLMHRHEDAADRHDRRGDQHGAGQLDQQLDLLDVVGGAGQQRRRAEPCRLGRREARHVVKHGRSQIAAETHGGARAEVHRPDGAHHLQPGDGEHHAAEFDDGAGVALGHAVVDDRRVDRRQVQRSQRADHLKHRHGSERPAVRPHILPQQCQEHLATFAHRPVRLRGGPTPDFGVERAGQRVSQVHLGWLPLQCAL